MKEYCYLVTNKHDLRKLDDLHDTPLGVEPHHTFPYYAYWVPENSEWILETFDHGKTYNAGDINDVELCPVPHVLKFRRI